MSSHPELEAEQAYIDHAYECLDAARTSAARLRSMVEVGKGGTEQARYEREMIEQNIHARLAQLHLGDESLVFGRIDQDGEDGDDGDDGEDGEDDHAGGAYYIGRLAVADERQEPVVVDWRAPVAEPFYRATGRSPMGLARRRHFATRGRRLLDIEDELFGGDTTGVDGQVLQGHGALLTALEQSRTGRLGDIVATIQGEQDEIIRADLPGVLVVQGGPGTGKTVVALHRAAYLLYTYRFPLEGQGVLVIGPNRLFLRYIERVLPSLGEAGVEQVVLSDLVPGAEVRATEQPAAARVKGDLRMAPVLAKAVRDRGRRLRRDLEVGYGLTTLRLTVDQSARIVGQARRRFRHHNGGRRFVEASVFEALAASGRADPPVREVRERLRGTPALREALEWMWPVLTPAQLLHDLYGSRALIDLAAEGVLDERERQALFRPRSESVDDVTWTDADIPLLDEARALLGPKPSRKGAPKGEDGDEPRTYGHIVVDEAQDLSPMQLRMISRRSLNGSMTLVGDIAQATGAFAPDSWDDILTHLPEKRPHRMRELTIGYRIPAQAMALAARVLRVAAPALRPPTSVREGDVPPRIVRAWQALDDAVVDAVARERDAIGEGNMAVVCPRSLTDELSAALDRAGIAHGRASRQGIDAPITVVPVSLVKGLELDAVVVVEPGRILAEEHQGMRALYVALTRATKRLTLVHAEPLPAVLDQTETSLNGS